MWLFNSSSTSSSSLLSLGSSYLDFIASEFAWLKGRGFLYSGKSQSSNLVPPFKTFLSLSLSQPLHPFLSVATIYTFTFPPISLASWQTIIIVATQKSSPCCFIAHSTTIAGTPVPSQPPSTNLRRRGYCYRKSIDYSPLSILLFPR